MVAGVEAMSEPQEILQKFTGGSFLDDTRVVHDFVLYGFSLWDNIRKAMDFVELE